MSNSEHFDVVVVGSGFGGAVTAYRMAEAGKSVLVLERGKAYPPGSFPRSPLGLKNNFWDPSEGLQGMFDVWRFEGLDALISSGLGGGSLIYANVMIRKDPKWFVREEPGPGYEYWPVNYEQLEKHYENAEKMLGAEPYPFEHAPYDKTSKTIAYKAAAENLGLNWFLPKLAVAWRPEPGADPIPGEPIREARANIHGRTRETCRLVGECDIGCNYGAKNSLDYTYLTEAWHAGADIRTSHEVRSFEPNDGGGYTIHYVEHDPDSEGQKIDKSSLPSGTVTASRLVLSAGTLGSTYLLLRNRGAFPKLSPALGTHFCGNGDLLTFAVRCTQEAEGGRRIPRVIDPAHGPVITSAIRIPDALDGDGDGRGFYLEDAGFPEFGNWMLQALEEPGALTRVAPGLIISTIRRLLRREVETDMSGEISKLFGDCGLSAGVLPLLGMGRDIPDGRMWLEDGDELQVDWRKEGRSEEYFERVREVSHKVADQLGSTFLDNPLWYFNRVITVHALGGCPMGRNAEEGVVDSYGEVFGYPGLHVADGSVMPGPVGANPSLTIAAVADRSAEAVLDGKTAPLPKRSAPAAGGSPTETPAAGKPGAGGVSVAFTEEMKGFATFGELDFDRGFRQGKESKTRLMFHLTISTGDLDRFIADRDHTGSAEGWVECDALGGKLPVKRGIFNLFVDQDGDKRRKRMWYHLYFDDAAGHPLTLAGFKVVEDDAGIDSVWHDTSTLFTRVLTGSVEPGQEDEGEVLAAGILHILPFDFARQMTTFETDPRHHPGAVARFGKLFASELWEVYGPRHPDSKT
ncbi:MAG: cholesterol oxidase [Thermoleophilaceae bacterium]|nr:cholesterol oxidase [Thermoleophilaceae bacterium]